MKSLIDVFHQQVKESFRFLGEKYGYKQNSSKESCGSTYCQYDSQKCRVKIYYIDHISYQVTIEIVLKAYHYSNSYLDILDFLQIPYEGKFQSSKPDTLRAILKEMAFILDNRMADFLQGNVMTFHRFARYYGEMKRKEVLERMDDYHFWGIMDDYWKNKNYRKVYEIFSSRGESITNLERRRMEYARKQLEKDGTKNDK